MDSRGQLDLDDLPEGSALETCFAIVRMWRANNSGCASVAWLKWQQMEDAQLGDLPSSGCCLQAPKQPLPSLLTLPPHCLTCHHRHHLLWACAAGQAEDRRSPAEQGAQGQHRLHDPRPRAQVRGKGCRGGGQGR